MRISPLHLISTPVPVLNSLGLNLRVGLSSEDPMVGRHESEPYEAYLSVYSPEGLMLTRERLGQIPPNRRRFFDISQATRKLVPELDHLTVVHRIPSRLMSQVSNLEDEIEMPTMPDYSLFRSLIEYSYPQGGNGSVIYETPPRLNAGGSGHKSSNTLTFNCQTVLSETLDTYVVLIHYSVNPQYATIANYSFGVYSLSGELVTSETVAIGPFAVRVLDMARMVPADQIAVARDSDDGLSTFTFVGTCQDASILVFTINAAPAHRAIALEHTHPPQAYLFPFDVSYQRTMKAEAQKEWKSILTAGKKN